MVGRGGRDRGGRSVGWIGGGVGSSLEGGGGEGFLFNVLSCHVKIV